jgi:predicted transcriptional regulator
MKIKKEILDSVNAESDFGRIICCALYLNTKEKKQRTGITIHEQVATLTLQGKKDIDNIAHVTGFEKATVKSALLDIIAYCERRVTA